MSRPLFFRVSSLAYPNLLGKKSYVVVVVDRSGDRGQQQLAIQNHKIFKNNIPTTHWKSFKIDAYP